MKLKKEHFIIMAIQVTEVLGFSLILPFLPFYAEELGATPLMIGLILTSFSFFQFFSAPIMGKLSDHYGRKPMLIFSQFSTFVGFIILGFSNSLWMIVLSRVIDGLLGSNFTIAQAYLSDISSKKDRSKIFGLSSAAFGFGFLIGPAIGGSLAKISYSLPSFIAAGIALITIILTATLLKETVKEKKKIKITFETIMTKSFKKYFENPIISNKLWQFFTFILSHSIFVSMFALYANRQLGFDSASVGYVLAYVGLNSIIIRSILLPKLIDKFGEKKLHWIGVILIILTMGAMPLVNRLWHLLIGMTLYSFGSGVFRPVIMGAISRSASPKEQGAIMGVTTSLASISQIIGPLVGGFMINYFFPGSIGILAAVVMSIGLVLMFKERQTETVLKAKSSN